MEPMVSMVRDSTEAGGRDRFSCTLSEWRRLQEIGRTFGWKPRGATYVPARGSGLPGAAARHDYEPGEPKDYKQVDADDSAAWAAGLSEARRSPHLAAMIAGSSQAGSPVQAPDAQSADAAFLSTMDEFIEYAFGGAFSFARRE